MAYLQRLSVAERLALNDASVRVVLKLRDSFRRRKVLRTGVGS